MGDRVGVHGVGHGVDQPDDELGHVVAGRRLARENRGAGRELGGGVVAQPVEEHDEVQALEELPLVLVDALDLDVEEARGVGLNAGEVLDSYNFV